MKPEKWEVAFEKWFKRRNKANKKTTLLDACNFLRKFEGRPLLTKPYFREKSKR